MHGFTCKKNIDDTNTQPYHRYVFEYYKGCAFNIKDILCLLNN